VSLQLSHSCKCLCLSWAWSLDYKRMSRSWVGLAGTLWICNKMVMCPAPFPCGLGMRLCFTPPVSPNILSKSGGVRVSHPTTRSLNPGAYCSIVSNTAGWEGDEKGRRREEREKGKREGEGEKKKGKEGGWKGRRGKRKGVRKKKEMEWGGAGEGQNVRRICDEQSLVSG